MVLEAGQGKYGWSDFYREHFDTVYGADIEDYSAYHPEVISLQADFTQHIPLPDKHIDLLVSHTVLEHVLDVQAALRNFDRVVKVGGYVFITVSPLYFSARGPHVNKPERLTHWEHLDQTSPYYMIGDTGHGNRLGTGLNRMTLSDFLADVGSVPWLIVRMKLAIDPLPIPDYVAVEKWSEMNLRARGFFLLAQKESIWRDEPSS